MEQYFESANYKNFVKEYFQQYIGRYYIDWEDPQVANALYFAQSSSKFIKLKKSLIMIFM
jgi:hypothetical protein